MNPSTTQNIAAQPAIPNPKRELFIKETQEKLDKIQAKVTSMKEEGSRLAGDLKKKADENLEKLNTKYEDLKGKMESLKSSTEEKWQTEKEHIEKSFHELAANIKGLFS